MLADRRPQTILLLFDVDSRAATTASTTKANKRRKRGEHSGNEKILFFVSFWETLLFFLVRWCLHVVNKLQVSSHRIFIFSDDTGLTTLCWRPWLRVNDNFSIETLRRLRFALIFHWEIFNNVNEFARVWDQSGVCGSQRILMNARETDDLIMKGGLLSTHFMLPVAVESIGVVVWWKTNNNVMWGKMGIFDGSAIPITDFSDLKLELPRRLSKN